MSEDLPSRVDLRPILGPARDQGFRGTCVAFAATCCHEASYGDCADFAEEAIYWGAVRLSGTKGGGIGFDSAGATLASEGQPDSAVWPYQEYMTAGLEYDPPESAELCRPWRKCAFCRVRVDVDIFRSLLANRKAVAVIVPVFEELSFPSQGRISEPDLPNLVGGNHALVLVGYDDSDGTFLVRNSWGDEWGEEGYARMTYSFVGRMAIDAAALDKAIIR